MLGPTRVVKAAVVKMSWRVDLHLTAFGNLRDSWGFAGAENGMCATCLAVVSKCNTQLRRSTWVTMKGEYVSRNCHYLVLSVHNHVCFHLLGSDPRKRVSPFACSLQTYLYTSFCKLLTICVWGGGHSDFRFLQFGKSFFGTTFAAMVLSVLHLL